MSRGQNGSTVFPFEWIHLSVGLMNQAMHAVWPIGINNLSFQMDIFISRTNELGMHIAWSRWINNISFQMDIFIDRTSTPNNACRTSPTDQQSFLFNE